MLVLVLVIAACSSTNNDIESAQFNLDHGEYEAAIAILDDVVANDSTNYKATSLLASALFGRGFLGESGSYLGVFANFLEGQEQGKSNLASIETITPAAATSGKADIYRAMDLLEGIPAASLTKDNYLQLGFTQLATISIVGVVTIGALETEDPCALNFSAVDSADNSRFTHSLASINGNFIGAGIEDFATTDLGQQITQMQSDLNAAADLTTYLQSEFGSQTCP
jgi:hypothetical protein